MKPASAILTVVVMSALLSANRGFADCQPRVDILVGPVVNQANNHRYYLLQNASWPDSEAQAVCLGGHLVTINDEEEENWVWNTFLHYGGVRRSLWIGLSDAASEGNFAWSSGEPVTYTHWCGNEPNDSSGGEDFAATWQNPVCWNDEGESAVFNFGVVELTCQNEPGYRCGDGVVSTACREECDDGNTNNGDACRNDCQLNVCGDGFRKPATEQCDDGNSDPFDGCSSDCIACGNGTITPPEECDSSRGCDAQCRWQRVVGTGTPQSCTEAAFAAGLAERSVIFNCGASPVTITITSTKTIAADTTIDGGGSITISGGGKVRVFTVNSGVSFDARNLTIAGGYAYVGSGGGIYNWGDATLTNCTVTGNSAELGGGIDSEGGGVVTLTNSTLIESPIYTWDDATLTNCTLIESPIENRRTATTLTNCTLIESPIQVAGDDSIATLTNCTLIESAITNRYYCGCCGSYPSCNSPVTVSNTIIAGPPTGATCVDPIIDGGYNVQWPGTSCGETIPSLDPLLDPTGLADNGGPTRTIALCTGAGQPHPDCPATSQAIDAGDTAQCPATDQRGAPRPYGTACDIGAFESGGLSWVCDGDCSSDGAVTVDELITQVSIALGTAAVSACAAADRNQDGTITVDDILVAVNHALNGCPVPPAPLPTYTATPTPTPTPTLTPTMTPTPTITLTPTATVTGTPPTSTPTPTITRTGTPTLTAVPTATVAPIRTTTMTPTPSPTPRVPTGAS